MWDTDVLMSLCLLGKCAGTLDMHCFLGETALAYPRHGGDTILYLRKDDLGIHNTFCLLPGLPPHTAGESRNVLHLAKIKNLCASKQSVQARGQHAGGLGS